jgi:hypothetical protein
MFFASNSKIHLEVLDFVVVTFNKPAALLGRVGESAIDAFSRGGIAAFEDERAVDYGSLFHRLHCILPGRRIVKSVL